MIAGKVLMDRNAPPALCDTAASGYESRALIERWHGNGRLQYAVTLRFAPTSLARATGRGGRLLDEYPGVYLHTIFRRTSRKSPGSASCFPGAGTTWTSIIAPAWSANAACSPMASISPNANAAAWRTRTRRWRTVPVPTCSSAPACSTLAAPSNTASASASVATSAAAPACRCWPTSPTPYKIQQLRGTSLDPFQALYPATLGGARALDLDGLVGNFLPGREADFVALDLAATPMIAQRMEHARGLADTLFVLNTLATTARWRRPG